MGHWLADRIDAGVKLAKADSPGCTFEVIEMWIPLNGPPHARTRVRMMNRDLGIRLYSVSALRDRRLFRPMDATP